MRIAIVSDIRGNRTAFEAVLADLRLCGKPLPMWFSTAATSRIPDQAPLKLWTAFAVSAGKVWSGTQTKCSQVPKRSRNLRINRPNCNRFGLSSERWRRPPVRRLETKDWHGCGVCRSLRFTLPLPLSMPSLESPWRIDRSHMEAMWREAARRRGAVLVAA